MDRTIINLTSIFVGGAGLLTVLTGFNVPQLNVSFFGENPFAVKRDVIENTMDWVFSAVALSGLVLQLWAEIWGDYLPGRRYASTFYKKFSVAGLIVVIVLVAALTVLGNKIAKWQWQPRLVALQQELFDRAAFVVEHDGWTPEHWHNQEAITKAGDADRYKANHMRDAAEHVAQIEDLLEIEPRGDLRQRLEALRRVFEE